MSNIKMIGNERIEIVNEEHGLRLRWYPINESVAPWTQSMPKEDLQKVIEVLQEAQRLFGLQPKQPVNNGSIPRGFQSDERTGTI